MFEFEWLFFPELSFKNVHYIKWKYYARYLIDLNPVLFLHIPTQKLDWKSAGKNKDSNSNIDYCVKETHFITSWWSRNNIWTKLEILQPLWIIF